MAAPELVYLYPELVDGGDFAGVGELFADAVVQVRGMDEDWVRVCPDNGTPRTRRVMTKLMSYVTVFQRTAGLPLRLGVCWSVCEGSLVEGTIVVGGLDFEGRGGVAVVAGASGGIGASIARMLARRGADLALGYRSRAGVVEDIVSEAVVAGGRAKAWQVDLTDAVAVAGFVDAAADDFGGVHTVVYAAGPHVPMVHLSRVPPARYREQLDADAAAFFNLVHAALPHLRAAEGGSLVAVTTAATTRFPVRDGLSSGSKGAVEAVVRAIAAEEGRFGVRANCVGPGMLVDGMAARLMETGELDQRALEVARSNIPLRRFGVADDIAEAVCFLASDRAGFISGQKLDVDGGYGV